MLLVVHVLLKKLFLILMFFYLGVMTWSSSKISYLLAVFIKPNFDQVSVRLCR